MRKAVRRITLRRLVACWLIVPQALAAVLERVTRETTTGGGFATSFTTWAGGPFDKTFFSNSILMLLTNLWTSLILVKQELSEVLTLSWMSLNSLRKSSTSLLLIVMDKDPSMPHAIRCKRNTSVTESDVGVRQTGQVFDFSNHVLDATKWYNKLTSQLTCEILNQPQTSLMKCMSTVLDANWILITDVRV